MFCICPTLLLNLHFCEWSSEWGPPVMTERNKCSCLCFLSGQYCVCTREPCARWRSTLRPFKGSFGSAALVHFLPYLIPASDPSYGGGQTEPGPGLPGGPSPVPRPGPGREGASLGVAGRAPEIGKKMGEAGGPGLVTGRAEDGRV